MATAGEEELEYESDPEEVKRSLAMRRKAASDDEEGDGENDRPRMDRRTRIRSDESDGQGGAAEYDDGEEDDEEGDYSEEEVYDDDDDGEQEEEENKVEVQGNGERGGEGSMVPTVLDETMVDGKGSVEDMTENHEGNLVVGEDEEEKKENEPFAVPTAGAFYMHDDRFRDNARGRHR